MGPIRTKWNQLRPSGAMWDQVRKSGAKWDQVAQVIPSGATTSYLASAILLLIPYCSTIKQERSCCSPSKVEVRFIVLEAMSGKAAAYKDVEKMDAALRPFNRMYIHA